MKSLGGFIVSLIAELFVYLFPDFVLSLFRCVLRILPGDVEFAWDTNGDAEGEENG